MKAMQTWLLGIFFVTACSGGGGAEPSAEQPNKPRSAKSNDPRNGDQVVSDDEGEDDGEPENGAAGGDSTGGAENCRSFADSYDTTTNVSGAVKAPIIGSINISVDADATVSVKSGAKSGSLSILGRVTNARPALAKSTAERGLKVYGDPMKMAYASSLEGWDGLDCLVMASKTLTNDSFDYAFDPALPVLVSPNADGAFSETIAVKSTVKRHFEEANGAKKGTYSGTAKLSKNGNAFKIEYDFGSGTPNIFATPFAAIEYVPDGQGGYERITAWIYITATDVVPVELKR